MEIEQEKLLKLRKDVLDAYERTTGRMLFISPTKGNKYLERLRVHMIGMLKITGAYAAPVPQHQTLIKFFFDESPSLTPETFGIFEEYSFVCSKTSINNNLRLGGAELIDAAFLTEKLMKPCSLDDFYLNKTDKDAQWFGISKGWFYEREEYLEIKRFLLNGVNFELYIVLGGIGDGVTTIIRKLVFDYHDKFKTFWIFDIEVFFQDIKINGFEKGSEYLLIVDDWISTKSSSDINKSFFRYISQNKNVKIIIGNCDPYDHDYVKYFTRYNTIVLRSEEKEKILNFIIENNFKWNDVGLQRLEDVTFSVGPLFLSIFLIALYYDDEAIENGVYSMRVARAEVQRIVSEDLNNLYNSEYRGIALALYYWSKIYILYEPTISFKAFIDIADFYNDNDVIRKTVKFDSNIPKANILSRYISLHEPDPPIGYMIMNFIDDLYAEALSNEFNDNVFYDKHTLKNILDLLLEKGELNIAAELFDNIYERDLNISFEWDCHNYFSKLGQIETISEQLAINNAIYNFLSADHNIFRDGVYAAVDLWLQFFIHVAVMNPDKVKNYVEMIRKSLSMPVGEDLVTDDKRKVINELLIPMLLDKMKRESIDQKKVTQKFIDLISTPRKERKPFYLT